MKRQDVVGREWLCSRHATDLVLRCGDSDDARGVWVCLVCRKAAALKIQTEKQRMPRGRGKPRLFAGLKEN